MLKYNVEASVNGHLEVVKYLVQQGVDVQVRNNEALIWASEDGHLEIVKYLVQQGADVEADDNRALRLAYQKKQPEVVKYLINYYKENNIPLPYILRN